MSRDPFAPRASISPARHNAPNAALDFLDNCDRIYSLRLHPHAETEKKAITETLRSAVPDELEGQRGNLTVR